MSGGFEYRDWRMLDITHIRFFDLKEHAELDGGCRVEDRGFSVREPDVGRQGVRGTLVQSVRGLNLFAEVYPCALRTVPVASPGQALNIMDHGLHRSDVTVMMMLNRLLKRALPDRLYLACRRLHGTVAKK